MAVDIPRFFNPITNLLEPRAAPAPRAPKPSKNRKREEEPEREAAAMLPQGSRGGEVAARDHGRFEACMAFKGARPGMVFKLGSRGMGYYQDGDDEAAAAGAEAPAEGAEGAGAGAGHGAAEPGSWVGMRTVADLRREQGVGAPRESDSLYRAIERKPRVFNPLKIPKNLQVRGCEERRGVALDCLLWNNGLRGRQGVKVMVEGSASDCHAHYVLLWGGALRLCLESNFGDMAPRAGTGLSRQAQARQDNHLCAPSKTNLILFAHTGRPAIQEQAQDGGGAQAQEPRAASGGGAGAGGEAGCDAAEPAECHPERQGGGAQGGAAEAAQAAGQAQGGRGGVARAVQQGGAEEAVRGTGPAGETGGEEGTRKLDDDGVGGRGAVGAASGAKRYSHELSTSSFPAPHLLCKSISPCQSDTPKILASCRGNNAHPGVSSPG